jgi:hypothetical protein
MPRGYGYGASMGAWIIDYVAAWAGEWGLVTHSTAQYRNPAFTGDATFITGEVIDYHDGVKDVRAKRLRMIGDPEARYREDPVRMLRAIKFAARFGFKQ